MSRNTTKFVTFETVRDFGNALMEEMDRNRVGTETETETERNGIKTKLELNRKTALVFLTKS